MNDHTTRQPSIKFCECGCGQPAPIATYTIRKRGYIKGQPVRYIHGHNRAKLSPDVSEKVCTQCGKIKPANEFGNELRNRDGLRSDCKQCTQERSKDYRRQNYESVIRRERAYYAENRGLRNALRMKNYYNDPERLEKGRRQARRWRANNRQHVLEYARRKYAQNSSRIAESLKASKARYPERVRARQAVYSVVRRGELPHVSSLVCSECGEAQANHYHHVAGYRPREWLNVIPICAWCHGKEHRADG